MNVLDTPVFYAPMSSNRVATISSVPFYGVCRLPTDPLFFSDVTLENIAVGSRYEIALASNPTIVLGSGTASATTTVVEALSVYTNPQLLRIRVRKSSDGTKYFPLETFAYQDREGAAAYISQVEDTIAS